MENTLVINSLSMNRRWYDMKQYTYSQFSFKGEGNEKSIEKFLEHQENGELVDFKLDIPDSKDGFWGHIWVKRVFRWSNGNVTVIGQLI